jgi:hypothetical protein
MRNVEEQLDWLMRINQLDYDTLDPNRREELFRGLLMSLVSVFQCLAQETRQSELIKQQQLAIQQLGDQLISANTTISQLNNALAILEDPQETFYQDMVIAMSTIVAQELHANKEECIADVLSGLSRCVDRVIELQEVELEDSLVEWWNTAKRNNFWRSARVEVDSSSEESTSIPKVIMEEEPNEDVQKETDG